ncbi:MAG: DUF2723 domain-containing protein [Ignavibacteriaceae bacterium]|nr:DUF2723 domain-containing protein [Ignavibacteriaceae bacterium]
MSYLNKYYPFLAGIIVFIIYQFTLAPSVIQIDSGELAAVQITLGIAHPTGYPLFTVLGYLFSLIPLPITKIYQMNLLASIYCAAAVVFFIQSVKALLNNRTNFIKPKKESTIRIAKKSRKRKDEDISKIHSHTSFSDDIILFASVFSGFILAFSKTFWFQSTSVEVYSLHLLLLSIIIFTLIKAYLQTEAHNKIYKDYWFILAFVLALGFSNHMTTLLILPAIAYLFFLKMGFNKASINKMLLMIGVFVPLLIIIYLYLPVRASHQPSLNWGNPIDLERILRHISGKQYQVWLFSSMESAKKQLIYYFTSLSNEFTIALVPILVGVVFSYFYVKRIFVFLLIIFASTVLYSINYDIVDIDSYFLLANISLSFFAAFGLVKLHSMFKLKKHKDLVVFMVCLMLVLIYASFNYKKVNQSNSYTFEDYTKSLLSSMDKKSIVLSYQWDFFISASYYFQNVEEFRKDVIVIDKELLRRSWYFNQLKTNYPKLLAGLQNEVNMFQDALKPFEREEIFNAQLLESLYRQIMTKLVTSNFEEYNVYLAPELVDQEMQRGEFVLPAEYSLVPDLFLFRVVKTKNYVGARNPVFKVRLPERKDYYINFIEDKIGSMLARRAVYELQFNRKDRAKIYIDKIKSDLTSYNLPVQLLKAIE